MSWRIELAAVKKGSFRKTLHARFIEEYPETTPAVEESFDAALDAVEAILESGAAGPGPYLISCQGHGRSGKDDPHAAEVGVYVQTTPPEE